MSKHQSLSTTVPLRTTFTWKIIFNLLKKSILYIIIQNLYDLLLNSSTIDELGEGACKDGGTPITRTQHVGEP